MPTNAPIKFIPGTLPEGTCFATEQERYNFYVSLLAGYLPGTYNTYVISDTEPSADDRDKVWIKTSATNPVRQYIYGSAGLWVWPHPIPASSSQLVLWKGNTTDLATFEGGDAGAITATTGAFWEVDTDLNGRFPIGVGTLPSGAAVALAGTGGADTHTLTTPEMPAHTHPMNTRVSSGVGGAYVISSSNPADTYTDSTSVQSIGGGTAFNMLPPYYGLYFIKRTARVYYVA